MSFFPVSDVKQSLQPWAGKLDVIQNTFRSAISSWQRAAWLGVLGVLWGVSDRPRAPPPLPSHRCANGRRGTGATGFCLTRHINGQNVGQRCLQGSLTHSSTLLSTTQNLVVKRFLEEAFLLFQNSSHTGDSSVTLEQQENYGFETMVSTPGLGVAVCLAPYVPLSSLN